MPTETGPRSDKDVLGQFTLGKAYLNKGKWHCECDKPARCRTTRKRGANYGRKFWICENSEDECAFFLWVDHEAAAKGLLDAQVPQGPHTPAKNGSKAIEPDSSGLRPPRSLQTTRETPFTKAKRKAALRDIPMPNDEGGQDVAGEGGSKNAAMTMDDPFVYPALPAQYERKAAKTSILSTPSQKFAERLKTAAESLATPQTGEPNRESSARALEALLTQARDTSPTPARVKNSATLLPKGETDLTTTVLDLIRADNPKLKVSTEMQIRHEIGLAMDLEETKVRRHEATISELHKRIDELETMILNLT